MNGFGPNVMFILRVLVKDWFQFQLYISFSSLDHKLWFKQILRYENMYVVYKYYVVFAVKIQLSNILKQKGQGLPNFFYLSK